MQSCLFRNLFKPGSVAFGGYVLSLYFLPAYWCCMHLLILFPVSTYRDYKKCD